MMQKDSIAFRLATLQLRLQALAQGRPGGGGVRLVAVTKTRPPAMIKEAYRAGIRDFGENRIQDLADKVPLLPADIEWHFIGHLQRNKVRSAVRLATWIDSVDSLELLERIERIAGEEGCSPRILLQVNISGEASKSGLEPEDCEAVLGFARDCRNLLCQGLMTMAPDRVEVARLRQIFGGLRKLRDDLSQRLAIDLPELSMGMSGDYETAIREGATMVRLGSAIFA